MRDFEWPINPIFVTQPFGARPQVYGPNGHTGIDLRTTFKDSLNGIRPVLCSKYGTVIKIGKDRPWLPKRFRGYGNHIIIQHEGGLVSLYAHLSEVLVGLGNQPDKGFVLGQSGASGWVDGAHLHFELRQGKVFLNPVDFLREV